MTVELLPSTRQLDSNSIGIADSPETTRPSSHENTVLKDQYLEVRGAEPFPTAGLKKYLYLKIHQFLTELNKAITKEKVNFFGYTTTIDGMTFNIYRDVANVALFETTGKVLELPSGIISLMSEIAHTSSKASEIANENGAHIQLSDAEMFIEDEKAAGSVYAITAAEWESYQSKAKDDLEHESLLDPMIEYQPYFIFRVISDGSSAIIGPVFKITENGKQTVVTPPFLTLIYARSSATAIVTLRKALEAKVFST